MATNDLNLESDSELSDAASYAFWTVHVEAVDVEFEDGEWGIAYLS